MTRVAVLGRERKRRFRSGFSADGSALHAGLGFDSLRLGASSRSRRVFFEQAAAGVFISTD